jgi:hypothetical protein
MTNNAKRPIIVRNSFLVTITATGIQRDLDSYLVHGRIEDCPKRAPEYKPNGYKYVRSCRKGLTGNVRIP